MPWKTSQTADCCSNKTFRCISNKTFRSYMSMSQLIGGFSWYELFYSGGGRRIYVKLCESNDVGVGVDGCVAPEPRRKAQTSQYVRKS